MSDAQKRSLDGHGDLDEVRDLSTPSLSTVGDTDDAARKVVQKEQEELRELVNTLWLPSASPAEGSV